MRAHLRTILPYVRHGIAPYRPPAPVLWSTTLDDPDRGRLRLTGHLREVPGASALAVLVHGLGGRADSLPCLRGAARLAELGLSTLSLSLRGADLDGTDFYNVALTEDVTAALASPALAGYEHLYVVGYSMGGYVTLHLASETADPRLRAVAAVCTPLDLAAAQRFIDSPPAWFYRRRVLRGLVEIYEHVARRAPVPTPPQRVRRVRTIHEWDRLAVAPRFGFDSPEAYYTALSVVPRLRELRVPALLVASPEDPVIPPSAIAPFLAGARGLEVRWVAGGGHLAFPHTDLALPSALVNGSGRAPGADVDGQVGRWLRAHG